MKLLELHLKAFGCLIDRNWHFHPQVNVIYGPNEAGKSTLQQAIVALLFGFYDNQRALAREREAHARFRPWRNGGDYAGSLHYHLANGARLNVHRDFSQEEVTTQLFDGVTGEDVTAKFSRGRHGRRRGVGRIDEGIARDVDQTAGRCLAGPTCRGGGS